jgi:preprotein translocase subunit Sec61beta
MSLISEYSHTDQMIALGLNQKTLKGNFEPSEFTFPTTPKELRGYLPETICRISVAMRVIQKVCDQQPECRAIKPEALSDWLVKQSRIVHKELWMNIANCLYVLCMHLLRTNLQATDLRQLAERLSTPEQFFADALRYSNEEAGLKVFGIYDEDEMDVIGIDPRYVEDHSFSVARAVIT